MLIMIVDSFFTVPRNHIQRYSYLGSQAMWLQNLSTWPVSSFIKIIINCRIRVRFTSLKLSKVAIGCGKSKNQLKIHRTIFYHKIADCLTQFLLQTALRYDNFLILSEFLYCERIWDILHSLCIHM